MLADLPPFEEAPKPIFLVSFLDKEGLPRSVGGRPAEGRVGEAPFASMIMLRKYFLSFSNQGAISLFNFVLNLMLVRAWSPFDYGVFALVIIVIFLLESIQNALITTPLSVYIPAYDRRAPRALTEVLLTSVHAIFVVLVFAVVTGFALLTLNSAEHRVVTAVTMGAYTATWLVRSYVRASLFAHLKPEGAAIVEFTFVGIGSIVLLLLWIRPEAVSFATAFGLMALGSVVGSAAGLIFDRTRIRITVRPRVLLRYIGRPWRDGRWALVGVITTTVQTRAHALVVATVFGAESFAVLAAGAVLFGPVRMLMTAWGMMTRPYLAKAVGRGERGPIERVSKISLASLLAGFALLITGLYVFWPQIDGVMYQGKYEQMGLVVTLWAVVTIFLAARDLLSVPLQSMRAFRRLAYATVVGAIVSLIGVGLLVALVDFRYSLIGLAVGEVVTLAYTFKIYREEIREVRAPSAFPSAAD